MTCFLLFSFLLLLLISGSFQATENVVYQLSYQNSGYYLSLELGSSKKPIQLAVDTSIPTSLINAIDCSMCRNSEGNKYDPLSSKDSSQISSESTYKKLRHLYTGRLFKDSFSVKEISKGETLSNHLSFISLFNISLTSEVVGAGSLSLSYFSDFVNFHKKKLFVLYLNDVMGTVTFGELDPQLIDITKLIYYPMTVNIKENLWSLTSDKLSIKRPDEATKVYNIKNEVIIDSNTWNFYIPKEFFYANIETIMPIQCQISSNDIFYCHCPQQIQTELFPTFTFSIGGNDLSMGPHQYMSYDSENNNCIAHFSINYFSNYWRIGINLLNENNTIFDYENQRIAFYDKTITPKNKPNQTSKFVTVFVSVAICSSLILFGGYYTYKRYHPILNQ